MGPLGTQRGDMESVCPSIFPPPRLSSSASVSASGRNARQAHLSEGGMGWSVEPPRAVACTVHPTAERALIC